MKLGAFSIDALIVHDVPRHRVGEEGAEVVFSDALSTLDSALRNFFTERIARSLSKNAFDVERDPTSSSPLPDLVESVLRASDSERDEKLVAASQEMARHLFTSQTGSNPPGLIVACIGRNDAARCAAVLKLEREDAIRVKFDQAGGKRTFNVQYLQDLMLGKNTKVFKASVFVTPAPGELDGLVSDGQRTDPYEDVANFFLHRFLGCRLKTAADVTTRDFFNATQEYINRLPDAEKKARYEIALIAAMNTPTRTMTSGAIAAQLDVEDRQPFRRFLANSGAPTGRFDKDTRLIAAQLRQIVVGFRRSKLRLSGPPEDVDEYVRFNDSPAQGAAPVEIHDDPEQFRGGTR